MKGQGMSIAREQHTHDVRQGDSNLQPIQVHALWLSQEWTFLGLQPPTEKIPVLFREGTTEV